MYPGELGMHDVCPVNPVSLETTCHIREKEKNKAWYFDSGEKVRE